jgi:uncharacterized protein (TIGR00730 family)
MGALNDTMLKRGGEVIGVIHEMWMPKGKNDELHRAITNLRVATGDNLTMRKEMLKTEADGFIVLPGGPGTYEEFMEIVSERQLGFHSKPLVIVDVDNFYSGTLTQFKHAHEAKLLYREPKDLFKVVRNAKDAVDFVLGHNEKGSSKLRVVSHESSSFSQKHDSNKQFQFGFGAGVALSIVLGLGIRSAL